MEAKYVEKIIEEAKQHLGLNIEKKQISATAALLEDGSTIPFIARYRKEATGSLDEVAVTYIRDSLDQLKEVDRRRESIINSLQERELLTKELKKAILKADSLPELEDIYLPFRPKRRTRASKAKEKGLEPLALAILKQTPDFKPSQAAEAYLDQEKGVKSISEALAGARDIIAEIINEDLQIRSSLRNLFREKAFISSSMVKEKEEKGAKYKDYFSWNELANKAPSHRVLAMFRGEKEGILKVHVLPDEEEALNTMRLLLLKDNHEASEQVNLALEDAYKRLLAPSVENEIRNELKLQADQEAIKVFAENVCELLLSPPLGQRRVLAIDPGFKTGCKIACLDRQGNLLHYDTIYPHINQKKAIEAAAMLIALAKNYQIEAIAIGNGTASRETEAFVKSSNLPKNIAIFLVNESGASIYSASELARKEFPVLDLTVRGAISIGRRLMDPLAELVKIDPKSIGVGQYQYDVDQKALKQRLDDVVISCVSKVGVDLNTTSEQLLTYISGMNSQLAKNIIAFRNEHGVFKNRQDLLQIPRLGPKSFEQAAGFLRITNAENPLDNSAVHPESYYLVENIAQDLNCSISGIISNEEILGKIEPSKYLSDKVGLPTILDILKELAKPGRDPRPRIEVFSFAEGIEKIEDLKIGLELPGIVTNVTNFGAFVDIGVHHDGLVHISQLADYFVGRSSEVVKPGQQVTVTVIEVDLKRKRISLSMKKKKEEIPSRPPVIREKAQNDISPKPDQDQDFKAKDHRPERKSRRKKENLPTKKRDRFKSSKTEKKAKSDSGKLRNRNWFSEGLRRAQEKSSTKQE